jgi:tetratricopeptide (TPR) repeat protein
MLSDSDVKIKFEVLANKLKVGLFDEVINEASTLLKKRQHQVFFNILSLAYQATGNFQKSADIMEEALRMNANNPYFLNNMGITQHKLENFQDAEHHFLRGIKIAPNYINILNNLGNLKKDLNYTNEAIKLYKKSLSINNNILETQLNIAFCYQSLGNYNESIYHLNKALKIDPKSTVSDRLISTMKKYKKDDEHLNKMILKINKLKLNDEQLSNLYFSLGKAYEDIGDYEQSFLNYKKGNKILKKIHKFDINDVKKNFNQIKNFFHNYSKLNNPKNSKKIIFIIGMPRSGTSLIEQILSSHKDVYGGGELTFMENIVNKKFLKNFKNIQLNQIPDIDKLISECHDEYIDKVNILNNTQNFFTDKAPLNFRFIGFIKSIFPNSKIINCKRDFFDTAWSNYKNYFPSSLPFTNDLTDLSNYYMLYSDLINFWKKDFANDIFDIEYENLVKDPKNEIKRLLKFCELEWDNDCMSHEKNSRSIKTASATQARKPIYKSAINSSSVFKKYLIELSENLKN